MRPTFFGSSAQPLFGVHHAPANPPRDMGVVLFYPGVQEYGSAHWAVRNLAAALAARGFHTFRFDYRGTGDSAGEPEDGTVEAWTQDAFAAHDEIRDATGVTRVSFIGLRLGATIAAITAAAGAAVDGLFLWDPVVSGRRYLDELELLDAARRLRLLHRPRRQEEELAGYSFPRSVRDSIAALDLREVKVPSATRVEAFVTKPTADILSLRDALERRGTKVDVHATGEGNSLGHAATRESALLATDAIATIVTRVERST